MKHIKIGVFILGLCLYFSINATGQTKAIDDSISSGIDSTVNVAYKTIHRNDLPNAISVIKPSDYLDKFYGTFALDGIIAFVGGNNLWNIGNALVLVDGIPRSIYDVNSSEIDQITFLKGANAVVLYGSRAVHGVVLITTKRGESGSFKSNIRINSAISIPKSYPEYLNSAEYMNYYNQARVNDGLTESYDTATINKFGGHTNPYQYPDIDYYSSDYLRKLYNTYDASADFYGATDRARFYALAGFIKQNSLLNIGEGKNENITRLNFRGNIDFKINDYISTYVNVSNVFYDGREANGNYWRNSTTLQPHRFSPLIPISAVENDEDAQILVNSSRHIIDGKYLLSGTQENLTNPIADAYAAGYRIYTSRQFQYTSGMNIDLSNTLEGLSFKGQIAIDYSNSYVQSYDNMYAIYVPTWTSYESADSISTLEKEGEDKNPGNQNLGGTWNDQVIDFNFHFDYINTFKEKHNVSAMILAAGIRQRQTGDYQDRTNANLGLQLAYNFNHKYYADFSGAVINSTKLSEIKRVAFSPTASLGWLLSGEDFLKNSTLVNRLKLYASAGIINTDRDINNYFLYNAKYSSTAWYSWADGAYVSQATTISRGENKNLTFSKRKEVNLGLEGILFNKALDFQTNLFLIKKDGIPVQSYTQYPVFFRTYWPETSFVPYVNFEANSYRGVDFQLNYNKKIGDVKMILGAAGTFVTTEALVRDENFEDLYRNRAGKPTDAIFGLESEGLFMSLEDINTHEEQRFGEVKPGDIKYKDQNSDGIIDERDEVMLGRWGSPFSCGLHFTAEWKGLTLFVLGTAQFGGTGITNDAYYWVYGERKYSAVVRDSWTEETKNTATYPRLTTLSGDNNFRYSDFWTYSTNRIDLSKIQLTYSLPERFLGKSPVKNMNIYISGTNLATFSKNKDIMELNIGTTPQIRFYNLGIKAVF